MKPTFALILALLFSGVWETRSAAASFLERLGFTRRAGTNSSKSMFVALSEDEVARGLKEALNAGVAHAVTRLSQPGGFLDDAAVRIPIPESLRPVEAGLRGVGQGKLVDDFVASLNRAAEKAVPEAAQVLAGSLGQLTLADARTLLTATNNAATEYFRRTSQTNLEARLRPIVAQATEETGVTGAYKALVGRASFATSLLGGNSADLDTYVTRRALDGLFVKIGDEEQRIRENPAARTTELLQKVFGSVAKP